MEWDAALHCRAAGYRFVRSVALSVCFVLGASFAAGSALAQPGDSLHVYSAPAEPNGPPLASFVDEETGRTYQFAFIANEGRNSGGSTTFLLKGLAPLSVCTTHAPSVQMWPAPPDPNNPNAPQSFNGNTPMMGIECGTAFGQRVTIKGCVADVEAHGYVHSDHPHPAVYAGTATIDVRYEKSRGSDRIHLTLYTPKEKIKLSGKVKADTVTMPSCQQ